jgi:hypothetical protein
MTLKRKDYKCFSPPLFCCWIRDLHLGSDIRDPGSEIRDLDGKFRNRRSGIIIQDPQHCLKTDLFALKLYVHQRVRLTGGFLHKSYLVIYLIGCVE